ncbi:MAG: replication endonuclease [Varibaculum sp.]
MDSIVHRNVANPAIRRCELMVRMRGFEDMANEEGLAGGLHHHRAITLSCGTQ